jgi:hypothetical protein
LPETIAAIMDQAVKRADFSRGTMAKLREEIRKELQTAVEDQVAENMEQVAHRRPSVPAVAPPRSLLTAGPGAMLVPTRTAKEALLEVQAGPGGGAR